jgi:hypothetical protein
VVSVSVVLEQLPVQKSEVPLEVQYLMRIKVIKIHRIKGGKDSVILLRELVKEH